MTKTLRSIVGPRTGRNELPDENKILDTVTVSTEKTGSKTPNDRSDSVKADSKQNASNDKPVNKNKQIIEPKAK